MLARIYQPARSAMQSGPAGSATWVLEYPPESNKSVDPLMGWTGSADMNGQVRLTFDSRDAAIAYADAQGLSYRVQEPKARAKVIRPSGYGDNFSTGRRGAWTH